MDTSNKMYRSHLNDPEYRGEKTGAHLTNGPLEDRTCTDFICYILFLLCFAGSIFVAVYSFSNGNPQEAFTPIDSSGMNCGLNSYAGYEYLLFLNLKAPNETVCVKQCPLKSDTQVNCKPNNVISDCSQILPVQNDTYSFLGMFCLPLINVTGDVNTTIKFIEDKFWSSDLQDLSTARYVLIGAPFLALFVSFLWIFLLRWCVGALTWMLIGLYFAALGGGGLWAFFKADGETTTGSSSTVSPKNLKIIAYVLWTVGGISLILVICWFRKISLAVAVLKCSSQFVQAVPSVLIIPIIFFVLILGFAVYWAYVFVYLWSTSNPPLAASGGAPFKSITHDSITKGFLGLQIWVGFWSFFFLMALPQFIIASCCCYWYFAQGKSSQLHSPLGKSLFRGFITHGGSIAFGAAIVAVINVIKLLFDYIHKKLQALTAGNEVASGAMKCLFCCIQCCLDCFERFIRFINRHAYIQIAMTGEGFCKAAEESFFLVTRNVARLGIVSGLGSLFSLIGEVFVSVGTAFFAYFLLTHIQTYKNKISSPYVPAIFVGLIAYVVGSNFMSVYGMAADSIIHVFCMDEEMHSYGAKHAPELLKEFINEHVDERLLKN